MDLTDKHSQPGRRLSQYLVGSLRRGTFWSSTARWLRTRGFFFPMSWESYVFNRYLRSRSSSIPAKDLSNFSWAVTPGLVSIVLPAYNGASLIREALDSVLAQTYRTWELIAVDDGSTDETGKILDEYATRDNRIRVIHQENQKLPRALNIGFEAARGEYLTWTSCDNRLYPDFLETLVHRLAEHPAWDMVYANVDIIGDSGQPLRDSAYFVGYQNPFGSEHIFLPQDTSELNVWPNNFIGSAFLYRNRVRRLIGNYSCDRFTVEDYDYWMRINQYMIIRHAGDKKPIYAYRFHANSLSSQRDELKIENHQAQLLVFDDFRRDFNLSPILWIVGSNQNPAGQAVAQAFSYLVRAAGHKLVQEEQLQTWNLPKLWLPLVYIQFASEGQSVQSAPVNLPGNVYKVLVYVSPAETQQMHGSDWDAVFTLGSTASKSPNLEDDPRCGSAEDFPTLFTALDIKARSHHHARLEETIFHGSPASVQASVIICSHRATSRLVQSLSSAIDQRLSTGQFEILVVNNNPNPAEIDRCIEEFRSSLPQDHSCRLRLVHCPIPGLSNARNAGISEALGEILCFIDDDAIAQPGFLASILQAFRDHPEAGVIGGKVLLKTPDPAPRWFRPAWKRFWSHFDPPDTSYTNVANWRGFPFGANWSARRQALLEIGGFRTRYGRRGNDYTGGEEIIAASLIQRLSYTVGVEPRSVVIHDVDPARFTLNHVWKTVRASRRTWYQAQKDLYIPNELGLMHSIRRIILAFRQVHFDSPFKPVFTLLAEAWTLLWYGQDIILRLRKPVTRS